MFKRSTTNRIHPYCNQNEHCKYCPQNENALKKDTKQTTAKFGDNSSTSSVSATTNQGNLATEESNVKCPSVIDEIKGLNLTVNSTVVGECLNKKMEGK